MDTAGSVETVDARGLVCPMPTIRLGQAVRRVDMGAEVELWTDDPGSELNMAAWTKNTGHPLVSAWREGEVYKYRIRRGR